MSKFASRIATQSLLAASLSAGLMCVSSAPFAAPQGFPSFAPDDSTGWVPARPEGDEFLPPPSGPGPVQADKAHPYIPNGRGQPTYRVADVTNPILQPWVVEKLKAANDRVLAGKVPYIPHERCWPGGVPGWEVYTRVRPIYFLETPKEVTIVDELDHQVRHVYMNATHTANLKPSWYGESVGHYEGDELVVDTVGLNDKTLVDNYGTTHTDKIHVVERWKLTDGGTILQVTVTVDDPGAFTMPWSAVQRYKRGEKRTMTELSCAENNFDFLGYDVVPLPEGKTPDF
jgi:hypothetical protein